MMGLCPAPDLEEEVVRWGRGQQEQGGASRMRICIPGIAAT